MEVLPNAIRHEKEIRSIKKEKEEAKLLCTGDKITNLVNTLPFIHSLSQESSPPCCSSNMPSTPGFCIYFSFFWELFHLISSGLTLLLHLSSCLSRTSITFIPFLCLLYLRGISTSWHLVRLPTDLFSFSTKCKLFKLRSFLLCLLLYL